MPTFDPPRLPTPSVLADPWTKTNASVCKECGVVVADEGLHEKTHTPEAPKAKQVVWKELFVTIPHLVTTKDKWSADNTRHFGWTNIKAGDIAQVTVIGTTIPTTSPSGWTRLKGNLVTYDHYIQTSDIGKTFSWSFEDGYFVDRLELKLFHGNGEEIRPA